MPITFNTAEVKYKDPTTGTYNSVNVVAEVPVSEHVARVQQAVADAQAAVNTLESQKNTIAQTVASMAQLGTDTTLSTSGMAADAKITGDSIGLVQGQLAPEFDSAAAYNEGQYLSKSGALYRLTADHDPDVTWDNTSKVLVAIGSEVYNLKGAIANGLNAGKICGDVEGFLAFEPGTYRRINVGDTLSKWNSDYYDSVLRRLSSIVIDIPFDIDIQMFTKPGYVMNVYETVDNVITKIYPLTDTILLIGGHQYGITLRAESELSDISTVDVFDMLQATIIDSKIRENTIKFGYSMIKEPYWFDGHWINVENGDFAIGEFRNNPSFKASEMIPVLGKNKLLITMPRTLLTTAAVFGICFYDKNSRAIKQSATNGLCNGTERDAQTIEVFVPENARYFRTTYWADSMISEYSIPTAFNYSFTPGNNKDDAITHETPSSKGLQNAVRRARQITDIKWSPLVDIPRYCTANAMYYHQTDVHFLDWCKSGKEYKGIPYSGSGHVDGHYGTMDDGVAGQWGYYQMFVGLDIDFETFITAARYPNSIMGTKQDQQAYNFDSSPYGDVCSALVSYALGIQQPIWGITNFCTSRKGADLFRYIGDVSTVNADDIKLGDVIHEPTHISIITDITRDTNGTVTAIEVSEAVTTGKTNKDAPIGGQLGGLCIRKVWSIEHFRDWFRAFKVYRYNMFTELNYTKSPYVDTGNEGDWIPPVDLPCIPYLGNKARYKTGHIVNSKILIGATGYQTLVVTKDGAAFGTYDINGRTEIEVGFASAGNYEAHLVTSNNKVSYSCEWTVEEFSS